MRLLGVGFQMRLEDLSRAHTPRRRRAPRPPSAAAAAAAAAAAVAVAGVGGGGVGGGGVGGGGGGGDVLEGAMRRGERARQSPERKGRALDGHRGLVRVKG